MVPLAIMFGVLIPTILSCHAHTAAGSVALAASLATLDRARGDLPNTTLGRRAVMDAACKRLRNDTDKCVDGDLFVPLYHVDVRPGSSAILDDVARGVWIASAVLDPAVALVFTEPLACVHDVTVASASQRCPQELRPTTRECRNYPTGVLRRVEELVAVDGDALACAANAYCLSVASTVVARECGSTGALDVEDRIRELADANAALLDGVRGLHTHAEHEPALDALAAAHVARVALLGIANVSLEMLASPEPDDDGEECATDDGRRLGQSAADGAKPTAASPASTAPPAPLLSCGRVMGVR